MRESERPTVRHWLRRYLLPVEHGAWCAMAESSLMGLLVAPTAGSLAAALGSTCGFLARRPLKLLAASRRKGRPGRRRPALLLLVLLLLSALFSLLLAVRYGSGYRPIVLLIAVALPLGAVHFTLDLLGRGRTLPAELSGVAAITIVTPAVILAGGGSLLVAGVAWAFVAFRQTAALLHVRYLVRRRRGIASSAAPSLGIHGIGPIVVTVLWLGGHVSLAGLAAVTLLTVRAVANVLKKAPNPSPRGIGLQEAAVGLIYTLLAAMGPVGLA